VGSGDDNRLLGWILLGSIFGFMWPELRLSTLLDARTAYNVCVYDSELDGWQLAEINAAEGSNGRLPV
jgi:hypothetical protein